MYLLRLYKYGSFAGCVADSFVGCVAGPSVGCVVGPFPAHMQGLIPRYATGQTLSHVCWPFKVELCRW